MSSNPLSLGGTSSFSMAQALKEEPVTFTQNGQQYSVEPDADGGTWLHRGGDAIYLNAEQAADLSGVPNQNVLFGAPLDAPDASFQGKPLGQLFGDPPSSSAPPATEPLW
jgi:hypothetical protein